MPSIDKSFIDEVLTNSNKSFPCLVETGTYVGETIYNCHKLFDKIYTIEIKEDLHIAAKNMAMKHGISNTIFILGDSTHVLKHLELTENTIFFLDAHWSSGSTGRGLKDCPLIEEITDIYNTYTRDGILIIDDFRLFGTNCGEDWSLITKESIIEILKDRIEKIYHLPSIIDPNDRLVIHLRAK